MYAQQIAARIEEFEAYCRCAGIPLTVQRRAILEAVLQRGDHPTADEIAEIVQRRVPGISRTTVYRVLDMLVDAGFLRRVHHAGPAARFDGEVLRHHHLVCRKCAKILDWHSAELDRLPLPDTGAEGFVVEDYSVQFTGLCPACRRAKTD